MANNKIAILGGKGMLGSDLALACQQHKLDATVLDLPEFDITNQNYLSNALEGIDAVINCAAYTNVEKAESQTELAYKVNAEAVGKLGLAAEKAGVWVLHISTDFVFDGASDKPYTETDKTNPINAYGASKLKGEQLLIESRCSNCIMRVEWTYGSAGNNFVAKMVKLAKAGKTLKVVDDQIGSPTATTEVAGAICKLLQKKPQSLFHFAGAGYVSRFEMAKFIFDKLNMSVDLNSCKTADFPAAAKRPLNSCFDCGKISALLDEPIKPWQVSLERFLETL
ncbi:MAG: dTDP-4-dehydrorhamnose reductase [Phycisphaerae bacterium]|nr:dTDP-4-dehydrorhamnose reductase [Phycisphaerae bacterium]